LAHYSGTRPHDPLHFGLVARYYNPPLNFSVTYCFIVLFLQCPSSFFSRPSVTLLCSFCPPTLHLAILSCRSAGLRPLLRPIFSFVVFLFTTIWTDFYLLFFVMLFCSPPSFSTSLSSTPQLGSGVSWLCTCRFYHAVALGYDLSPILLFCLDLSIY